MPRVSRREREIFLARWEKEHGNKTHESPRAKQSLPGDKWLMFAAAVASALAGAGVLGLIYELVKIKE